jgi:predicted membrane channel-forming protein YqfA (hemolysin III family)
MRDPATLFLSCMFGVLAIVLTIGVIGPPVSRWYSRTTSKLARFAFLATTWVVIGSVVGTITAYNFLGPIPGSPDLGWQICLFSVVFFSVVGLCVWFEERPSP